MRIKEMAVTEQTPKSFAHIQAEAARQSVSDVLTSGWDKDRRFTEAHDKFMALVESVVPEQVRIRDHQLPDVIASARSELEELAYWMAAVATDVIADRWYDAIVPEPLRAAETRA